MTATHDDLQRSIGRMEGHQSAMEHRMDRLEKSVADGFNDVKQSLEAINERLGQIETRESERKGAFSLAHWLYGAGTGLAAFLASHLLK